MLRCHIAAFKAMGGVPGEILYDRMRTAVAGEANPRTHAAIGRDGMVSVAGNLHSVPDTTRRRVVEVQNHPGQVRIFEDGALIAAHPVLEGRNRQQLDPSHRTAQPRSRERPGQQPPAQRPLDFHAAVGQRLAGSGERS